jgi:2,3-bisphosphoglycerate-dependent phosphoglycerate mutase
MVGLEIEIVDGFRERKVDSGWIEDFDAFSMHQWEDFTYKLSDGECLQAVQQRNMEALHLALEKYKDKNIIVGSHGTAIGTVINYFDNSFLYAGFQRIQYKMPWVVEFSFDENTNLIYMKEHDLF